MNRRALIVMFLIIVASLGGNQAEHLDDLGPLPPIETISLNAPLQLDEVNEKKQKLKLKNTPKEISKSLEEKNFPLLPIVAFLLAGAIYVFVVNQSKRVVPKKRPTPLTHEERLTKADELLKKANEILSEQEMVELFSLLDPIAEALSDPQKYLIFAEQAKFAGYKLKKIDITFV